MKMEEITATHWNESASRLQMSACELRRSPSHPDLPRFTPLFSPCVGDIVIYVQEPFFSELFCWLGNNSPRTCSERHSQEQICGRDLWLAHVGHCFCLVFLFLWMCVCGGGVVPKTFSFTPSLCLNCNWKTRKWRAVEEEEEIP